MTAHILFTWMHKDNYEIMALCSSYYGIVFIISFVYDLVDSDIPTDYYVSNFYFFDISFYVGN